MTKSMHLKIGSYLKCIDKIIKMQKVYTSENNRWELVENKRRQNYRKYFLALANRKMRQEMLK